MAHKHKKLEDVFKDIDIRGPDDCWNFTGHYNEQRRMPEWKFKGKNLVPYRIVYELVNGPIPDGLLILHSCDNRRCCNPKHHSVGTVEKNNQEANERERHGVPAIVVRNIRKLLGSVNPFTGNPHTHSEIAELYGMSRSNVTAIANRYNHNDDSTDVNEGQDDGTETIQSDNPGTTKAR